MSSHKDCEAAYREARRVAVYCLKCKPSLAAMAARLVSVLRMVVLKDRIRHRPPKLSKAARAVAFLMEHPEWSDTEIARAAGCERAYLYRIPQFVAAREALKSGREKYKGE